MNTVYHINMAMLLTNHSISEKHCLKHLQLTTKTVTHLATTGHDGYCA